MKLNQNQLQQMAKTNPSELAKLLINPNGNCSTLTFGVEILGEEIDDPEIVLPVIRQLLKHVNALVREGAIIGAEAFFQDKKYPNDILEKLLNMSNNDPSPILRELSKEIYTERK